ncbi:MAG TPA: MBL fold metallo-hydrolase [Burkholderiales bacterium]|nr:MBL fold metallo-hydrolase [Burkholderiales bacterium]
MKRDVPAQQGLPATTAPPGLPPQVRVIVRDWLNANHILFSGRDRTVLIDSGYGRDARITLAKVSAELAGRPLDWLVNTHCHSDHMGGNAAVRQAHRCRLSIPAGEAPLVEAWDEQTLWLSYADQRCERFAFDDTIAAGDVLDWGDLAWRAIAAPGHDMGALMFYCEEERLLISGDALWQNGFGVVLPGPGCEERLSAARATLESIARLDVATVIPGHGHPFGNVAEALDRSRERLEAFARDELRMARHVLKVMFVFSLLDRKRMRLAKVAEYLGTIPLYADFNARYFQLSNAALAELIVGDLERAGVVRKAAGYLIAAG